MVMAPKLKPVQPKPKAKPAADGEKQQGAAKHAADGSPTPAATPKAAAAPRAVAQADEAKK